MTTENAPRQQPPGPGGRRIRLPRNSTEPSRAQSFSILVVCTAHHCRSPVMDAIWTARARDRFGSAWRISSAGTNPRVGLAVHPLVGTALAAAGIDPTIDRAVQLDAESIRSADLILTAERRHRAEVVRMVPAAVNRAFTLREFARLAGSLAPIGAGDPVTTGLELVRRSRQARADHVPVAAVQDDLVDPMGHGADEFADCVRTVQDAVDEILSAVTPPRRPSI